MIADSVNCSHCVWTVPHAGSPQREKAFVIFVVLLQASIAIDDKIGLICNQKVLTTNIFTANSWVFSPLKIFVYATP